MMRRHHTISKRIVATVIVPLLLTAAALLLLLAGTALADDSTDLLFSLEPTAASAHASGYFIISTDPGRTVQESAVLRNLTDKAISVSLAPVDGTTGLYGGVTYALPTDQVKAVGSWMTLTETQVDLGPSESKDVHFTINVPDNAPTGFNVGGLTAWVPAVAEKSTSTSEGFSAQVIIQTRRVLAVQVNLPGDTEPVLQISGVTANARPAGMYLDIGLTNTGHGLASGKGTIKVSPGDFQKDFDLGDVVPGTSFAYPIVWSTNPDKRSYDVTVSIDYNGKTVDYTGSFKVGDAALTQLSNVQTTTTAGGHPASKPAKLSNLVLIAIIVGAVIWSALVAGVALLLATRAKRRRRAAQSRNGRPDGPPPTYTTYTS